MHEKCYRLRCWGLLLLVGLGPVLPAASALRSAPNLIVILTDDQGYADVGFNGCRDIPTPNLDRIARAGVRFTNGYVSYPVCGPSRAGLMTGRYQQRFGFRTNPSVDPHNASVGIPLDETTLAEALDQAGYACAAIGKWHLGSHPTQHPLARGFDEFVGFLTGGHQYFPDDLVLNDLSEVTRQWGWYRTRLLHNHRRITIDKYLTDALSDAAVDFIDRNHRQPFFLYLAYNAPHTPLQATEETLQRVKHIPEGKRRVYGAMICSVDDGVGRILASLEDHEIVSNTLVFFLSDNGGSLRGGSTNGSSNAPLRDGKGSVYEGGIRVPFAAQWPETLPAGVDYESPVISLDIFATITALAGVAPSTDHPLDGVNLIPHLTGANPAPPHDILFWRQNNDGFAARLHETKLVRNGPEEHTLCFDLAADVGEASPIPHSKRPADTAELQFRFDRWNTSLKDAAFPGLGKVPWWNRNNP